MDLREVTGNIRRHPWEIARAKTLMGILEKDLPMERELNVLDLGCGDAYILTSLSELFNLKSYHGVDINLSDQQIEKLSIPERNILFHNNYKFLEKLDFGLILALDVIEHVENDHDFIATVVQNYIADKTKLLLTAPAYNILFSSHDIVLGHYRRYNLKKLKQIIFSNHLRPISSGYIFFSLVPIRVIAVLYEKIFRPDKPERKGAGHWIHGVFISKIVECLLAFDNKISLKLSSMGIKLPGLTVWTLSGK